MIRVIKTQRGYSLTGAFGWYKYKADAIQRAKELNNTVWLSKIVYKISWFMLDKTEALLLYFI